MSDIKLTFKPMSSEEITETYLDIFSAWDKPLAKSEPVFITRNQKQNIYVAVNQKEKE